MIGASNKHRTANPWRTTGCNHGGCQRVLKCEFHPDTFNCKFRLLTRAAAGLIVRQAVFNVFPLCSASLAPVLPERLLEVCHPVYSSCMLWISISLRMLHHRGLRTTLMGELDNRLCITPTSKTIPM